MSNENFKIKVRSLRPFVSFKVDLRKNPSKYLERKVQKYYDDIEAQLWTYNTVKRLPRNKSTAKKVLKNVGLHGTEFKAIPIRPPANIISAIKFSEEGFIKTETRFGEYIFVGFDRKALAKDSDKYFDTFFDSFKPNQFTQIKCGNGLYASFDSPDKTKKAATGLIQRYGGKGEKFRRWKGKDGTWKTNHYKNWLSGVNVFTSKKGVNSLLKFNQISSKAKISRKNDMAKIVKELRKNENRKNRKNRKKATR